jgi:MOSC domain-containing protein YiiM
MGTRASITVGHYTYSAQDARKTVDCLAALWAHHTHESTIPDGWLAGARGFIAEMAALGSVSLPPLDNVDNAMRTLNVSLTEAYPNFEPRQIESLLAAMWRFFPTMRMLNQHHTGTIAHLHASKGLPKKAIDTATITWRGVDGDVQSSRVHHGRPWQALCLWSTEAIDTLHSQGHPIAPGYAGENITISGIPADAFRPGAQFRCGSVRGFFTAYSLPCSKNSQWFINKEFNLMHYEHGPLSRVYAMVTHTGHIAVGDTFELFTDR